MKSDDIKSFDKRVKEIYLPSIRRTLENYYSRLSRPISDNNHRHFSRNMAVIALHKCLLDKDLKASKQLFYISGLSQLRMYAEFCSGAKSTFVLNLPGALPSIFSDAVHLHPVWASLRHPAEETLAKDSDLISYRFFRLYQEGLLKNWAGIEEIAVLMRHEGMDSEEWVRQRLDFYDALCAQNSSQVESALQVLLDKKVVERDNAYFKDFALGKFMCSPTMWLAKLAWICGHEIEIDHPLIVSELLPCEPLDSYVNPYEFLIDPVLDNKPITVFGGDIPVEEVEKRNRFLYGNDALIDSSGDPFASSTQIPIVDGVNFTFYDITKWVWEFESNKFIARKKSGALKVIITIYPVKSQADKYGFVKGALGKLTQALDKVHDRTGQTMGDMKHNISGIEYKDRASSDGLFHYQVAKYLQLGDQGLLVSLLFQYSNPDESTRIQLLAEGVVV